MRPGGASRRFSDEEVQVAREGADLAELVRRSGVALRKSGPKLAGLCPFHDDKDSASLSIDPRKGLFYCFGCGIGGDAISWLQRKDGLQFGEAVAKLLAEVPEGTRVSRVVRAAKKPASGLTWSEG